MKIRTFLLFGLILIGLLFVSNTNAGNQGVETRVEKSSSSKFQSGVITLKPAKTSHYTFPRVRKTVVRVTKASPPSPVITSTTSSKSNKISRHPLASKTQILPTNPPNYNTYSTYAYTAPPEPSYNSFTPLLFGGAYNGGAQQTYQQQQKHSPVSNSYGYINLSPIKLNNNNLGNYYYHNSHLQGSTSYSAPPPPPTTQTQIYAYAPAYYSTPTSSYSSPTTKNTYQEPIITKAKTIPVSIYYAEEAPSSPTPPITTVSPPTEPPRVKYTTNSKRLKIKKVRPVSSPPTITYHTYKPLTYQQQQLPSPQLFGNVYYTTPGSSSSQEILNNYIPQPASGVGGTSGGDSISYTTQPYYSNPAATIYPLQQSYTIPTGYYTNTISPNAAAVPSNKVKPSGLGITYSEVGPGIASYNFQGFGVQYGY